MTNSFCLNIPVKPYLKQFLTAHFGPSLLLPGHHVIGTYALLCLEGKKHTTFNVRARQSAMEAFTESYTLELPFWLSYAQGSSIPPHNIILFNRLLDDYFDQQLFMHAEMHRLRTAGTRYFGHHESLRVFLARFAIEEDVHITFDALRKRSQRIKKRMTTMPAPKKNLKNSLRILSPRSYGLGTAAVA